MNTTMRWVLVTFIAAAGLVGSAFALSHFFVRIRHEKTLVVKGYTERPMRSETGKLSCTMNSRQSSLQDAHAQLVEARERVHKQLLDRGFSPSESTTGALHHYRVYAQDEKGNQTNNVEYYEVSQRITVSSRDVERISSLAVELTDLIGEGYDLSVGNPEFYLPDLTPIKVDMLAEATADAYTRAQTLAENSGAHVGALVSAKQGIFQITEPDSTETSSYGIYNTSSIEKVIKAVVTLEYALNS